MVESLSNNADKSDVDAEVEDHRANEVHDSPQPPDTHDNAAHAVNFAAESDAIDTRRAINQLVQQNAEQDFELGLEVLEYQDGQYEIYATNDDVAASTGVVLNLGSSINGAGYVQLKSGYITDPTTENAAFTGNNDVLDGDVAVAGGFAFNSDYNSSSDPVVRKLDGDTLADSGQIFTLPARIQAVAANANYVYAGDRDGNIHQAGHDMNKTGNTLSLPGETFDIALGDNYGYAVDVGDGMVVFNLETLAQEYNVGVSNGATSVAAGNGMVYIGQGYGSSVVEYDPSTNSKTGKTFDSHTNDIRGVAVDSSAGVSGDLDDNLYLWSVDDLTELGYLDTTYKVYDVGIDTNYVYAALGNGDVVQVDRETMTENARFTHASTGIVEAVEITLNGGYSLARNDNAVRRWGDVQQPSTQGETQHTFTDVGFVPGSVVVNDEVDALPTDADIEYQLEDSDGNSITVPRSDVDSEVPISNFTSTSVSTTAKLTRQTADVSTPKLDSWAVYLSQ